MILAVDIGNTNITAGLFRGERLVYKTKFPTSKAGNGFSAVAGSRLLREKPFPAGIIFSQVEAAVICSVVPKAESAIKKTVAGLGDFPIYIVGRDLIVPIKNLYGRPKQVGQDRLVCAYAAMKAYGVPVIAIDLGTALTFDAVSKNGEYLGGVILPGLNLSLRALHQGTALLPQARLGKPGALIGKDTKGSMLSGLVYGFGSLIDGLVEKLRREIGEKAKIALTGGDARLIRQYCSNSYYFEPDLILKGLKDLAPRKKNAKKT